AQAPHAFAVTAMQRLLHPIDAKLLELARHGHRVLERPGRVGVLRQAPTLIAIDHQLEPRADALPHCFERLDVLSPIAAMETDLERRKTARAIRLAGSRELSGLAQRAGRRIGAHAVREAPKQFPARLTGDLAGEIPERQIE